jgi:general secretion pathway protein D
MDEVELLVWKAKFIRREAELKRIADGKEDAFVRDAARMEEMSTMLTGDIQYDGEFDEKSAKRFAALMERERRSPIEEKIRTSLRDQQFQGSFNAEPLSQAVERLAQLAGVNIDFDRSAIDSDATVTERPITKNFGSPISVESALKLVIADAGLVFTVEDEVVKITSRDYQRKNVRQETYYVGDLVVPVNNNSAPMMMNFMNPYGTTPVGGIMNNAPGMSGVPLTVNQATPASTVSPIALAQQLPNNPLAGLPLMSLDNDTVRTGQPYYNQMAPQSLGGITAADFNELIQLIQNVIEPTTWEEDGPSIRPYPNTLSLIVTQTQEVHDQIQDLLEKLRELNDVQIVIEVRFITLQDNFFERIGVDFDFDIEDNNNITAVGGTVPDQVPGTRIVGLRPSTSGLPLPTADLDVGLNQNSFASAIPQFGGFDASTAANFGFAILSDIEVFFLIQASKGDTRTNVMQAPTVTLINGQTATVFDGSFRPFVTSLIPIVGDFAAAQQPVISWLPEGSSLNVRGTASNDRRYITMTLVPFFSQISRVDTFTFESRRTDQFGSGGTDGDGGGSGSGDDNDPTETIVEGTTVQLPTIVTTTVSTTVNVPDGGTVLIGGIKRLSEGRNERGVPFLSNIPYVNRLFKNVGIGRETSSLMMMVTPRIIIQQEEEQRQVGEFGG